MLPFQIFPAQSNHGMDTQRPVPCGSRSRLRSDLGRLRPHGQFPTVTSGVPLPGRGAGPQHLPPASLAAGPLGVPRPVPRGPGFEGSSSWDLPAGMRLLYASVLILTHLQPRRDAVSKDSSSPVVATSSALAARFPYTDLLRLVALVPVSGVEPGTPAGTHRP